MKNIILLLLLISSFAFGQMWTTEEWVDKKDLSPWTVTNMDGYEGIYFFGESEAESELSIAIDGNQICVQLKNGDWAADDNGEITGWKSNYTNYTNVKIEGNHFFSDQTDGEFVIYQHNDKKIKCLKLNNPPVQMSSEGHFELGPFSDEKLENFISGKYIQTKFDIIDTETLMSLSKTELSIMRNEIYARYGYIFRKGGKMANHFEKLEWYKSVYKNVDAFLTTIEKENLKNIQQAEKDYNSIIKTNSKQNITELFEIEGTYTFYDDTTECSLRLDIFKSDQTYNYKLKTPTRNLSGTINLNLGENNDGYYITINNIEWSENLGQLDEEGEQVDKNVKLPKGLMGYLYKNSILFQNYGNAMNYYVQLAECDVKYIQLERK